MVYSIIQKSKLESGLRIDAEYYQPEYLGTQFQLSKFQPKKLSDIAIISDGNHLSICEEFVDVGVRYLRGKDLNSFFISNDDPVYIPEKSYVDLKRSHIFKNDVLISIVGTVGLISIVPEDYGKLTGNCKIAIIRSSKTNPWFLSAFLLSKYGQNQIQRKKAGAVQMGIILQDVAEIQFPTIEADIQVKIGKIVKSSFEKNKESDDLIKESENILLEELKIGRSSDKKSFVVNFSEIEEAERMDAEYFQPKYIELIKHIKENCSGVKLGDLVTMKKGFEPGAEEYKEGGKLFIRVSSLSKNGIDHNDQKYLSDKLYNEFKNDFEPQQGEILLTKDATPGMAYVVKDSIEGIISSGILRLKLKSKEIEDEYLALCLNSIIGQMQAERDAGGSVIAHWKPDQIKNVTIPILPKEKQEKISSLIRESFAARVKAKELLEEAKRKVEEMIEKGAN